jgi:bifunctional polynucleotide phosphatase/kinase
VAFDVDHTIVKPSSGYRHPRDEHDWEWWHADVPKRLRRLVRNEGKKLVFFSNQADLLGEKRRQFQAKLDAIIEALGVPVQVFVATTKDVYRKPSGQMWHAMCKHFNGKGKQQPKVALGRCMFVGDAAGRPAGWDGNANTKKDFADSDRLFAECVGIPFATPDEFFLNQNDDELIR